MLFNALKFQPNKKIKKKVFYNKIGFCFATAEEAKQFRMAAWAFKKYRDEGTFPGFGITEMDYLMKAKSHMDSVIYLY